MRPITYNELAEIGDPIIVHTFGRSGTHMIIDLLRRQFRECRTWKYPGEKSNMLHASLDDISHGDMESRTRTLARMKRSARPIFKTHAFLSTMGE